MENVISIQNLSKSFGERKSRGRPQFPGEERELFAFLGVNGAGKSTTISIICGQLKKDSGSVRIHEMDVERKGEETKRLLGVVFQDSVLDRPLTVKENLKSRAALYGIMGKAFEKRLGELVELLDFREFLNRPVGKLSGGQRRRIDIARALLHKPELLILDEPTTGLGSPDKKADLGRHRENPADGKYDGFPHDPLYGGGGLRRLCHYSGQRKNRRGRNTL